MAQKQCSFVKEDGQFCQAPPLKEGENCLMHSPEHAQVTTLPVSLSVVAVASWVGISGTEELGLLKRLLPGGSATELVVDAWNGGVPLADSLPLLAPTLGWVLVAVALAGRLFRWEPRR